AVLPLHRAAAGRCLDLRRSRPARPPDRRRAAAYRRLAAASVLELPCERWSRLALPTPRVLPPAAVWVHPRGRAIRTARTSSPCSRKGPISSLTFFSCLDFTCPPPR